MCALCHWRDQEFHREHASVRVQHGEEGREHGCVSHLVKSRVHFKTVHNGAQWQHLGSVVRRIGREHGHLCARVCRRGRKRREKSEGYMGQQCLLPRILITTGGSFCLSACLSYECPYAHPARRADSKVGTETELRVKQKYLEQ